MNTEAIAKLKRRIANHPIEDADDFMLFIPLASRMKALGDSSEFDKIGAIVQQKKFPESFDAILEERCRRGIWDVQEQFGEELGLSIIEAQDFWLFYNYAKDTGLFSASLNYLFEEWSHETFLVTMDEETADTLRSFLMTYPIPEEYQLAVVMAPVTEFEYDLIDRIAETVPVHHTKGKWTRQDTASYAGQVTTNYADTPVLTVACDDDEPSTALLLSQDRLSFQSQTLRGILHVQRQLNERWQLVLTLEDSQGNSPDVDFVRVGILPFAWNEEDERWILNMKPFDGNLRQAILKTPIVIRLSPIDIVEITF